MHTKPYPLKFKLGYFDVFALAAGIRESGSSESRTAKIWGQLQRRRMPLALGDFASEWPS
jgi:hypothetical protein